MGTKSRAARVGEWGAGANGERKRMGMRKNVERNVDVGTGFREVVDEELRGIRW